LWQILVVQLQARFAAQHDKALMLKETIYLARLTPETWKDTRSRVLESVTANLSERSAAPMVD
jgi:hypothetical protein